jgi:hypothetical protein
VRLENERIRSLPRYIVGTGKDDASDTIDHRVELMTAKSAV